MPAEGRRFRALPHHFTCQTISYPRNIVACPPASYRWRTCRTDPEIFAGFFSIALCIGDDGIDQFQNILLTADVMERIVSHGFFEVDGVQDFDLIPGIREHLSTLDNDRTLGVRYNIADLLGHLHQVRLDIKSCLTAAAAADYNNVFIPSILRMLWSTTHHQPFGLCEDDVVLEYRVNKRFDVLLVAP